jgi:hypothetical protein
MTQCRQVTENETGRYMEERRVVARTIHPRILSDAYKRFVLH